MYSLKTVYSWKYFFNKLKYVQIGTAAREIKLEDKMLPAGTTLSVVLWK